MLADAVMQSRVLYDMHYFQSNAHIPYSKKEKTHHIFLVLFCFRLITDITHQRFLLMGGGTGER